MEYAVLRWVFGRESAREIDVVAYPQGPMVIVTPPGVDPDDELWYERLSDEEFIASQIAGGLDRDYAAAVLEILRGEGEPVD